MQIIDLTSTAIGRQLGRPVSELEVAIAKNLVLGIPKESLKDILGADCTVEQIEELEKDEGFKQVHAFIAQYVMKQSADTSLGWEQLESLSVSNLITSIRTNKDPDLNLRVAAVANKAIRRHNKGEQVLDPMGGGQRVTIQLTERFIRRLSGKDTEVSERSVRLSGVRNPTFDELGGVFNGVSESADDVLNRIKREDSSGRLRPLRMIDDAS